MFRCRALPDELNWPGHLNYHDINIDSLLNKLQSVLDKLAGHDITDVIGISAGDILVLLVQWQAGLQQRQTSLF